MYQKFLSTILIISLMATTSLVAQDNSAPVVSTDQSNNSTINRALDSNITGQIVKRLGEPGFYVSKFLNFRKQINRPVCTLSEQINLLSVLTSLTGEVTTHAFDYFELKKLERQFAQKILAINKYEDELSKSQKKILDFDSKAPEIQIDSLKHLKSMAEIELKRAEMVRVFVYTSLALSLTSKILASMEGTAEITSFGSTMAQTEACKKAKLPKAQIDETKASALANGAKDKDNTPWYLAPFLFLAKGVSYIESSGPYQTYKSYKNNLNKNEFVDSQKDSGIEAGHLMQLADSAGYAEEMMVDVVSDVIRKWKDGKRDITEEVNNFNKNTKNDSGIMKFFKAIGAEEIAIRFAVRSLIKQNIIAVDAFMHSGFGRFVIYAYNVYSYYRTIAENQAQVEYAKAKVALIDKTIKEFESKKTTLIPSFKNLFNTIIPEASAALTPRYIFPRPPCLRVVLSNCSLEKLTIISPEVLGYYNSLPAQVRESQRNVLSNNYALASAFKLATGKFNYEEIDLEKIKMEVKKLESYSDQLEKKHPTDNSFLANQSETLKKMSSEIIFPESMNIQNNNDGHFELAVNKTIKPSEGQEIVKSEMSVKNESTKNLKESKEIKAQKSEKEVLYKMDIETIYTKDTNIFQIITNRYLQIYIRKELIE